MGITLTDVYDFSLHRRKLRVFVRMFLPEFGRFSPVLINDIEQVRNGWYKVHTRYGTAYMCGAKETYIAT